LTFTQRRHFSTSSLELNSSSSLKALAKAQAIANSIVSFKFFPSVKAMAKPAIKASPAPIKLTILG